MYPPPIFSNLLSILVLLSVSNMYSLRTIAGKIQVISMFSKIAALAWIIGIGAYFMAIKGSICFFPRLI